MSATSTRLPSITTSIALSVALAGPPLFVVIPEKLFGGPPSLGLALVLQLLYGGMAGFLIWNAVRLEGLTLESIGLRRPKWSTLASAGLVLFAVLCILPLITTRLVGAFGSADVGMRLQRLGALPVWFRMIVGVTGGIIEETLYRGYAIERFATITGRRWLGATIATIAFGLAHVPVWGIGWTFAAVLPFGIVMTLFYLWSRDLVANMVVHSSALVVRLLTAVP